MSYKASDGTAQERLVATGTPVPGTDAKTYRASDGTLMEALPIDVTGGGSGEGGPVDWADVTGKPSTFPPIIGTTPTTAKAGNYAPAWGDVTDKPTTFPPITGTTAGTAKAGDYAPTWAEVTAKPAVIAAGATPAAARALIEAIGIDQKGIPNGVAPLDSSGLVPLQHLNVSGLSFSGAWNAATNTPTLLDGTGTVGQFYKVSEGGTFNFGNGSYLFTEGDWVIYAAGVWQRIGVHESVASVNGKTGMVSLTAVDVGALPANYVAPVVSVNGKAGAVTLTAADVGAKPASYAPEWGEITGKPDLGQKIRGFLSPPTPALYGFRNSDQMIPSGVETPFVLTGSEYDQFGILSGGVITVPAWATHIRLSASINFGANTAGIRYVGFEIGGLRRNAYRANPVSEGVTTMLVHTPIRQVTGGQTVQIIVWQGSGVALPVTMSSWVQIELFTNNP